MLVSPDGATWTNSAMTSARLSLANLLLLLAGCLALARPPFLRAWVLPMVAARLGVTLNLNDARSHGLLEGLHLHGLSVASTGDPGEPFLKVGILRVRSGKGTLWNPERVILEQAELNLRFDSRGNLLTRLPEPDTKSARPTITLKESRLRLAQDGRPPWTLMGIRGTLTPHPDGYQLQALVSDPTVGNWTAEAKLSDSPPGMEMLAKSDLAKLHMPDLERLPFIDPDTWNHVGLEGTAHCELSLKIMGQQPEVSLAISNPALGLTVPVVGLTCHVDRGRATIQPGLVKLEGLMGQGLGGALSSPVTTLDFRGANPKLEFSIAGSNLDGPSLAGLAKSKVARNLRVSGTIAFSVVLAHFGPVFEGRGNGVILAGPVPLPWRLSSQGGHLDWTGPLGLRFSTRR